MNRLAALPLALGLILLRVPAVDGQITTVIVDDSFDDGGILENINGTGSGHFLMACSQAEEPTESVGGPAVWPAGGGDWSGCELHSLDKYDFLGAGGISTFSWVVGKVKVTANNPGGPDCRIYLGVLPGSANPREERADLYWNTSGGVFLHMEFESTSPGAVILQLFVVGPKARETFPAANNGSALLVWDWENELAEISVSLDAENVTVKRDGVAIIRNSWTRMGFTPGGEGKLFNAGGWGFHYGSNFASGRGGHELHRFKVFHAASAEGDSAITWGPVFNIITDSDISQAGVLVEAANVGDDQDIDVTIGSETIHFAKKPLFSSSVGNGGFFEASTGNVDFDNVLDSHSWQSGSNAIGTFKLIGLKEGLEYQIQLIAAADTRECCANRGQATDDGLGKASGEMRRNGPGSVIGEFIADATGEQIIHVSGDLDPGLSAYILRSHPLQFVRGDSNGDGGVDISDAVKTLFHLFLEEDEPACQDASDSNDDGELDISDAINTLGFLFLEQGGIPSPGPFTCGFDPTEDGLVCQSSTVCPREICPNQLDGDPDGSVDCQDPYCAGFACVPEELVFLQQNPQGYYEYVHKSTGIVLVRLPGGKFNMGSPDTEQDRSSDEGPVHEVTLSPFLIAKYEVTQAEWTAVMGSNPSWFTGDDTRPVEVVSWDDIQGFEAKTGLSLPSEAQWEYACRAWTSGPYAGTGNLDGMGWYSNNSGGTTHPVGQKAPNAFGLYDMHGNVYEWCEDGYDGGFYAKPEASGPDPLSLSGSVIRVFRGGSWSIDARYCRSAFRNWDVPSYYDYDIGFRPARPLQ